MLETWSWLILVTDLLSSTDKNMITYFYPLKTTDQLWKAHSSTNLYQRTLLILIMNPGIHSSIFLRKQEVARHLRHVITNLAASGTQRLTRNDKDIEQK